MQEGGSVVVELILKSSYLVEQGKIGVFNKVSHLFSNKEIHV